MGVPVGRVDPAGIDVPASSTNETVPATPHTTKAENGPVGSFTVSLGVAIKAESHDRLVMPICAKCATSTGTRLWGARSAGSDAPLSEREFRGFEASGWAERLDRVEPRRPRVHLVVSPIA
jgi:hypothetical protein